MIEEQKKQLIRDIREGVLKRPDAFDTMAMTVLLDICNGCGSSKAKFDFVPDTMYGLSIAAACFIHDLRYSIGGTEADRLFADQEFRDNINTIIKANSWWLSGVRRARAAWYYYSVRFFGASSFNFTEITA